MNVSFFSKELCRFCRALAAAFVTLSFVLLFGCDSESESSGESGDSIGTPAPASADNPLADKQAQYKQTSEPSGKVVVYSARKEHLIKGLFDAFTQETGIKVEYITDKAQPLMARMQAEGERTPADLFITVDAGNLWQAANLGLLKPLDSKVLNEKVPEYLRDPQGRWFGLSKRARTMVYSTERMKPEDLSTYEALVSPQYKGRLCLRTSKKVYNQSLVGTLIARLGEQKAEEIVKGWVNNLAAEVFSNDTAVIKAIVAGQCDVGIVNSYYFGRLIAEDSSIPAALFWANQSTSGTHINISGAGIAQHAKNEQAARQLLEWLVSDGAQKMLADSNFEYPVVDSVPVSELVQSWGEFKSDQINIDSAGAYQAKAIKVMDRAGYK